MGKPVVQFQMITRNPDALGRFYAQLFDWEISANNALGYRTIDTGSEKGINGGIWPAPPEAPTFVQLFVEVDDVAAYVTRATAMGARILVPPSMLPDGDEMAVLHDPEGMSFAVYRSAPTS